jgi:hypothetical protein
MCAQYRPFHFSRIGMDREERAPIREALAPSVDGNCSISVPLERPAHKPKSALVELFFRRANRLREAID